MIKLRREIVSFSKVRVVASRPRDVELFVPLDKKFRLLNARRMIFNKSLLKRLVPDFWYGTPGNISDHQW